MCAKVLTPAGLPPTFKAWFARSLVVDASGNPLLVYHGSEEERRQFRKGFGDDRGENLFPQAFFFTPELDVAAHYGPVLTAAYLRIEAPYVARTAEQFARLEVDDAERELRAAGYDGAILYPRADGVPEYVAFEPLQIQVVAALTASNTPEIDDERCTPRPC